MLQELQSSKHHFITDRSKIIDKHSKISAHHTRELRCENMSKQSVKKRFDLVGKKFENQLFKTNPPSTSGSFNSVRCLRSSLGSSPRICKNSGFLEKLSVFLAHKQKGVKSSLSGIKILNPILPGGGGKIRPPPVFPPPC